MLGQALARVFADFSPALWDKDELDITDSSAVKKRLVELNPELIINTAAFTDVDGAEENKKLAHELNGKAVKNLVDVANEIGATFVQYSTAYVFDGKNPDGYKEEDLPNPSSVYGESKLEGEREAVKAKKYYILRLDRLFGKAGEGKTSFIDKMLELAKTKKKLTVIADEYGCPTYAPDLAKRTREILEKQMPNGVYHCANEGSCSWYEWAREIFKIKGIDIELKKAKATDFSRKATRPKYGVLNNTKLPKMRSWKKALAEYLE